MDKVSTINLRIKEARAMDAGRGIARIDPSSLTSIGARIGDVIALTAERTTHVRALPAHNEDRGQGLILIDGATRANLGAGVDDSITISRAEAVDATKLVLAFEQPPAASAAFIRRVAQALEGLPVCVGDAIRLKVVGGRDLVATVSASKPDGVVFAQADTHIEITSGEGQRKARGVGYDDLGGLSRELAKVREMIELPIRRPEIFEHLGVDAPKGVLLSGPPGTGKTLLARTVAEECNATFFQINGPEIVGKHYGESEAQLRDVFERASAKAPSIVFIDEIDAIAPKREGLTGDRQVERRIVAQLLTLLDGVTSRGQVIVMAATNLPDSLDPALRRPGRFDREITIGVPDRPGRREIMAVHTRGMPLSADVDLDRIAAVTHGFVGADLAALAREAGMSALRRSVRNAAADLGQIDVAGMVVESADFDSALNDIRPSAVREVFTDVPDVLWSDVGGAHDVKRALTEAVIWPLQHGAIFDSLKLAPTKGVLLAGPPGTGKTLLAKALATEAGVNFISVRGPQLLNQYVGESERAVRQIFAKARMAAPCIIFFDEMDALAPVRGAGDGAVMERVVAQLLTEIDGVEDLKGVFLLAATNRVDRVDPALIRPGRFDLVLEMPLPNASTRKEILAIHTRDLPLADDVKLADLNALTDGFSGADLKGLVQAASLRAARQAVDEARQNPVVSADHFAQAVAVLVQGRTIRGLKTKQRNAA
ncbi:MAG: CDC48 family AAA ATPase [Beijerinckiaceae bacterium]